MTTTRIPLLRTRDLLVLELEPINLALDPDPPAHLRKVDREADAYLLFHLPLQSVTEERAPGEAYAIRSRAAGGSQIVFRLPFDRDAIPFTLDALLDWASFEPVSGDGNGRLHTVVEAPFRLLLSLPEYSAWRQPAYPDPETPLVLFWHAAQRLSGGALSAAHPTIEERQEAIVPLPRLVHAAPTVRSTEQVLPL